MKPKHLAISHSKLHNNSSSNIINNNNHYYYYYYYYCCTHLEHYQYSIIPYLKKYRQLHNLLDCVLAGWLIKSYRRVMLIAIFHRTALLSIE